MEYITVKQAAEKWGVTTRRVQMLCKEEKIKGVVRFGNVWKIPKSAVLPSSNSKNEEPHLPMPRKSPFLDMTDLYNTPGSADRVIAELGDNIEKLNIRIETPMTVENIEKIARETLGYRDPDEIIFYNDLAD